MPTFTLLSGPDPPPDVCSPRKKADISAAGHPLDMQSLHTDHPCKGHAALKAIRGVRTAPPRNLLLRKISPGLAFKMNMKEMAIATASLIPNIKIKTKISELQ